MGRWRPARSPPCRRRRGATTCRRHDGRERGLADLHEALPATGLLTPTGPGGCGKTRLALKAAGKLLDQFADGIWWVELAPLAEE